MSGNRKPKHKKKTQDVSRVAVSPRSIIVPAAAPNDVST